MELNRIRARLLMMAIILSIFIIGCAGTKGTYAPITPLTADADIGKYPSVVVEVKNNPDVALTQSDDSRIQTQIIANLRKEYSARFKEVNPAKTDETTLQAIVNITKYDIAVRHAN